MQAMPSLYPDLSALASALASRRWACCKIVMAVVQAALSDAAVVVVSRVCLAMKATKTALHTPAVFSTERRVPGFSRITSPNLAKKERVTGTEYFSLGDSPGPFGLGGLVLTVVLLTVVDRPLSVMSVGLHSFFAVLALRTSHIS